VKIVGVQTGADLYQSGNIIQHVEAHSLEVQEKGGNLICFPELFALPFFPSLDKDGAYFSMADQTDGDWMREMCRIAKETGLTMIVPFFEKSHSQYFNSAAVVGPDGSVLGTARKMFIPLTRWNKEKMYFSPGGMLPVFRVGDILFSVIICYDRHYPELARLAALQGVDLLIVPTCSVAIPGRSNTYEAELISRAIENNMYVMGVNRVGKDGDSEYFGKSIIVSPLGEVLSRAEQADDWVVAEISKAEVIEARAKFGHLRDVRKDIFEQIIKLL
jgi:beta-ureidopropionase